MRLNTLYPSKWLAAADLDDEERVLTMTEVKIESVTPVDDKPVLYFKEEDKGLVLNKTNAKAIEGMYGDDTDDWEGKQITIFPTQVDFQGKQVDAIRVKTKKPKSAKIAAPAPVSVSNKSSNQRMTQAELDSETEDPPF